MLEFCYLGDVVGQAGTCHDAVTGCMRSAWKAFHKLLHILTNRGISLLNCGKVLKAYVNSVLCMVVKHGQCQQEICHVY